MLDFYVEEIRAAAQCTGLPIQTFVYLALLSARAEVAKQIGIPPAEMAKLSKRQRSDICRKYCSVMQCTPVLGSSGN
jgi:hypothetical protein